MRGEISQSDPRGEYEKKPCMEVTELEPGETTFKRENKKLINTHAACILRSRISTIKKETQETKQREIIMLICERKQKKEKKKNTLNCNL